MAVGIFGEDPVAATPTESPMAFPHGLNLFVDNEGPTTSLTASVLDRLCGTDMLNLERVNDAHRKEYLAKPTLFSRVCAPGLQWLPKFLSRHSARYAYYLDDNLWEYRRDSALARYYASAAVRRSLESFIRGSAVTLVNSHHLANFVRDRIPSTNIVCVPASFDFRMIPSDQVISERSGPLRVGYAGSERGEAFKAVATAIERLLSERPGEFQFEFIGYLPDTLKGRQGVQHFEAVPDYRSFLALKQSRKWEVGLAPLEDDLFSRCKTNNKFREYGALGIVGLYSDVVPYADSVSNGRTGMLVGHGADAWTSALEWALAHRAALSAIGAEARKEVWARHRLDVVAAQWAAALADADLRAARTARSGLEWHLLGLFGRLAARSP
ncbi:glycosyltransferase [Pseudoxanthomonas sp. LH2527]|uniref:glycosyltransferase n=1 Tax=Pseudoxanthomonas sp. LH2527 TaxID=2923249 RepID=UPI001F128E9B|nr:glycosyltransferase [Pseudoxanthomonas sp. LH2527]MCH6482372.1 glycosyltransferase [Pseudoxanthomonas sp. LH2527]